MIRDIINDELIEIYFQPIVSIRTKKVYGFESLTRCTYKGEVIPPDRLFDLAKKENLSFELDVMTRNKAIKKFSEYYKKDNNLILFLNFESTLINNTGFIEKNSKFVQTIKELEIPFINFVLEIKEDEITNTKSLKKFSQFYKNLGFSIALDDFGTGSSTFDRVNLIKPNIIKIDKSLFNNIENNQVNKEIVKAISKMCHNIGIRVLAEGVEEQQTVLIAMKMGINIYQGYYFSKPQVQFDDIENSYIISKIVEIGNTFRTNTINTIKNKRKVIEEHNLLSKLLIDKITNINECSEIIKNELLLNKKIEAIYIIDEQSSKQIHDTFILGDLNVHFRPSKEGEEHYLKDYYYITLESKKGMFLSNKYISYATGSICKTFAKKFTKNNINYILCLDLVLEHK